MIEMMRWTIYYRQRELTFVLHRPIEVATQACRSQSDIVQRVSEGNIRN
jgi:hypothetical protein